MLLSFDNFLKVVKTNSNKLGVLYKKINYTKVKVKLALFFSYNQHLPKRVADANCDENLN